MRRRVIVGVVIAAVVVAGAAYAGRVVGGAGGWRLVLDRDHALRLYRARSWKGADTAFREIVKGQIARHNMDPLPQLAYDVGNTDYRLGKFERAEEQFHAAEGGPPALQERAEYNLGNAYLWQARGEYDHATKKMALKAAVESYESALVLDPRDVDAKWNLEVALKRLEDADEHFSMSRRRDEADWGGGNLTKAGYAGTPQTGAGATPGGGFGAGTGEEAVPDLTPQQAHKMLDAVEKAQVSGQEITGPQSHKPNGQRSENHEHDW
jgi:Ca-activated chloride channel family protein